MAKFYTLQLSFIPLLIMHVYVRTASHGVLWSRLCHRPGEEDQRKLPQRRLDRLHLSRGAQGKVDSEIVHSNSHRNVFTGTH